jgi:hypothetical protein
MEKNINKRIETYVSGLKNGIRTKITELDLQERQKINELLEYIFDYNRLVLTKEDFVKRKRVKNAIPILNRCNARRANGEQCTRQRKEGCEFCGTHNKGVPHGFMADEGTETVLQTTQKLEVIAEEIKGIVYYIDKFNNVYKTEDILAERENPQIIAKCVKTECGYTIPELGLV